MSKTNSIKLSKETLNILKSLSRLTGGKYTPQELCELAIINYATAISEIIKKEEEQNNEIN